VAARLTTANDQTNKYQDFVTKLQFGDPAAGDTGCQGVGRELNKHRFQMVQKRERSRWQRGRPLWVR
jgi:hypothetical protein